MEEIHEPLIDADSETSKKPRATKWINSDSAVRAADLLVGALAIGVVFWWLSAAEILTAIITSGGPASFGKTCARGIFGRPHSSGCR